MTTADRLRVASCEVMAKRLGRAANPQLDAERTRNWTVLNAGQTGRERLAKATADSATPMAESVRLRHRTYCIRMEKSPVSNFSEAISGAN